jgi:WbqC-like protein family
VESQRVIQRSIAYWPSVSWWQGIRAANTLELEAAEHYQKGGWRNRCVIAGPNGPQRLSIPLLKGKHQQTPIREVRIAYNDNWPVQHWRSIRTAYGNAPLFEFFADDLALFYEKKPTFLFDFNTALITFVLQKMNWTGQVQYSTAYLGHLPDQTLTSTIRYPQVFEDRHGFLSDLSVLDVLMCTGVKNSTVI